MVTNIIFNFEQFIRKQLTLIFSNEDTLKEMEKYFIKVTAIKLEDFLIKKGVSVETNTPLKSNQTSLISDYYLLPGLLQVLLSVHGRRCSLHS